MKSVVGEFDLILLDYPPKIWTLYKNVVRAADAALLPISPPTLSQRAFEQMIGFFKDNDPQIATLHAFFSRTQATKARYLDTMKPMRKTCPQIMLSAAIPCASDVERMGAHRATVLVIAPKLAAGKA